MGNLKEQITHTQQNLPGSGGLLWGFLLVLSAQLCSARENLQSVPILKDVLVVRGGGLEAVRLVCYLTLQFHGSQGMEVVVPPADA